MIPLATQIRPTNLDEIIGQKHLLAKDAPFRRLIESGLLKSFILYGPAGIGKTTIGFAIANYIKTEFIKLNATQASVKEIKTIGEKARNSKQSLVIFIDEIHRFSSTQQDALLPYIEDGSLIFIGATTENPFHSINSPLLSRCQIFTLEPLTQIELASLIIKGVNYYNNNGKSITIDPDAVKHMIRVSCGDGRKVISILEFAVEVVRDGNIDITVAQAVAPSKYMIFGDTEHFDLASAYQGSIQASDADAAVFWLAKWLESGEDPRYIARRLLVSAAEDAFSNPICVSLAHAAYISACEVGRPECDIVLSTATIHIAKSPRDKTGALAIWHAVKDVRENLDIAVPKTMKDSHYPGAKNLGVGSYHDGAKMADYIGVNKKYIK